MQWRALECEVNYTTILRRMHRWHANGVFETAYAALLNTYKKIVPTEYYCVDSAYVKNMSLVDHTGIPHGLCCHPGNRPDVVLLADTLRASFVQLDRLPLFADRGYDSRRNRGLCAELHLADRIFRRRCKTTRRTNAKRIVVEHTFAWLKQYRRLLCMYEHSAPQFLAFALMAFGNIDHARQRVEGEGVEGGP